MPTPEDVFARLHDRPGAVWLDGGATGRSIVAWDPVETVTDGAGWPDVGRRLSGGSGDGGFDGGCIGYLSYEAGARVERALPAPRPTPEPEIALSRYEGGLTWDPADGRWTIAGTPSFRRAAARLLDRAAAEAPPPPAPTPRSARTTSQAAYEDAVRRVLDYIAAGDCYQVNLSRPVHLTGLDAPWPSYRRLRHLSAPPYGAFLRIDDTLAVLSNSPELFLDATGRDVASLPIKGTRPRHPDPVVDRAHRLELRRADKDRAELTMIVDLVRNDLGRVAVPGSVTWGPREITAHANVHHASQRVSARLCDGLDVWDALAAAFPPGSVTGAPKVRACQRIAELEPEPRGVYCGAIGFVSGARSVWNVAIRTAVRTADTARFHVGGGVVADSDPTAEWWETVHKGTVLARAFAGEPIPTADDAVRLPVVRGDGDGVSARK